MTRRRARALFFLLGLGLAGPAAASSSYPTVIQTDLGLSAPPPESCALCHTNGVTGFGTVNTPFGKSVRNHGLVAQSDAKLGQVLTAMAADKTDSDGDGVSDIDELKAGTDPNVGSTSTGTQAPLSYGCGAESAPGAPALGALLLWLVRRRGKTAP